jgi:hypothetical protein
MAEELDARTGRDINRRVTRIGVERFANHHADFCIGVSVLSLATRATMEQLPLAV